MRILISNDDGIDSEGIAALARAARDFGEVTVVAPVRERSTSGHSLTLHKPLRIYDRGNGRYATSGSPADCIYLGTREILKTLPDVILSGINHGANLGTDVFYSGTVAAAREGALMNLKSYAFSLMFQPPFSATPLHFSTAEHYVREILQATLSENFPAHTLLNSNIPNLPLAQVKGVRLARQGFRFYSNDVARREDPRGKPYYWLGGNYLGFEKETYSDCHVVEEGYVSLTPLTIDCTDNKFYTTLESSFPS